MRQAEIAVLPAMEEHKRRRRDMNDAAPGAQPNTVAACTWRLTRLMSMETFVLAMYDCPNALHGVVELPKNNEKRMATVAQTLDGTGVLFYRKPNPNPRDVDVEEETWAREIRTTLDIVTEHDVPFEFVLRDVYTMHDNLEKGAAGSGDCPAGDRPRLQILEGACFRPKQLGDRELRTPGVIA